MTTRRPIVTGKLWPDVDQLTRTRRQRFVRDVPGRKTGVVEYLTVDSLWDQLIAVRGATITSDGAAAKSTGSPSPLNIAATALLLDITAKVLAGLANAGLRPRWLVLDPGPAAAVSWPQLGRHPARTDDDGNPVELGEPVVDPQRAGLLVDRAEQAAARRASRAGSARRRHDTPSDLRRLADHLSTGPAADQQAVWVLAGLAHRWVQQAEEALALDDDPDADELDGVYGRTCPTCGTSWAHQYRDDDPDEPIRVPALVATMRDRQLRAVSCRVCGDLWWRGAGLLLPQPADQAAAAQADPEPRPDHDDAERRRLAHKLGLPIERVLP